MSVREDIERYLPHRPPMRLPRTLTECSEKEVTTESVFERGDITVTGEDVVEEAALLELVAQSYAALQGYEDHQRGCPTANGYLVGITQFTVHGVAHAGETLRTRVRTVGKYEDFSVGEGWVYRGDELIAEGTIKVWMKRD